MKLNFGRRLVLFVHWLLSLAGCALAVTLVVWPACRETALALLERQGYVFKIYAIAVLAVYVIFAVGAICIIFGGRRKRKDGDGFIVVDSGEAGHTRIAVGAVDQMIRQAVRGVEGITQMRSQIINNQDSVNIAVDVAILTGSHVPTVTSNIQRAIRGYIERNCGIAVRSVNVSVHALSDGEETGKRGRKKKTEVYSIPKQTPVEFEATSYASAAKPAAPDPEPANFAQPDVSAPSAPEPLKFDDSEPIRLTFDADPLAPEPVSEEAAPEAATEPEAPVEEPAATEPVPEPAPAAEQPEPAPKKGLFKRIFGKRKEEATEPTPETATEPVPDEPATEPVTEAVEETVETIADTVAESAEDAEAQDGEV